MVLQGPCAQPEVTILRLDVGLSSYRRTLRISLEEELGLSFLAVLLFLECFSFVSAFHHFPDQ